MTVLSFRLHRLSEHETVLPSALTRLVGQTFTVNAPGLILVGTVTAAHVRDGWIVVTSDINTDDDPDGRLVAALLPGIFPEPRPLVSHAWDLEPARYLGVQPKPKPPDWSAVASVPGPARLEQMLGSFCNETRG